MVVSSDAIALATFCQQTAAHPSQRQAPWSAIRNGTWPLSADTRFPVMIQDTCQFSGAVRVGSGRAIPACLNGRRVIALPSTPSPTPSNSDRRNAFAIPSSTGTNASPIPGVTRCTNAHSFWSYFCSYWRRNPNPIPCKGVLKQVGLWISQEPIILSLTNRMPYSK